MLKPFLKELAGRFDDLEAIDRVTVVRDKAAAVTRSLYTTMAVLDERESLLAARETETEAMATTAKSLFANINRAKGVAAARFWRRYRVCIYCAMLLGGLVIIAGVIVALLN